MRKTDVDMIEKSVKDEIMDYIVPLLWKNLVMSWQDSVDRLFLLKWKEVQFIFIPDTTNVEFQRAISERQKSAKDEDEKFMVELLRNGFACDKDDVRIFAKRFSFPINDIQKMPVNSHYWHPYIRISFSIEWDYTIVDRITEYKKKPRPRYIKNRVNSVSEFSEYCSIIRSLKLESYYTFDEERQIISAIDPKSLRKKIRESILLEKNMKKYVPLFSVTDQRTHKRASFDKEIKVLGYLKVSDDTIEKNKEILNSHNVYVNMKIPKRFPEVLPKWLKESGWTWEDFVIPGINSAKEFAEKLWKSKDKLGQEFWQILECFQRAFSWEIVGAMLTWKRELSEKTGTNKQFFNIYSDRIIKASMDELSGIDFTASFGAGGDILSWIKKAMEVSMANIEAIVEDSMKAFYTTLLKRINKQFTLQLIEEEIK